MKMQMIAKFRLYNDREVTNVAVGGFNFTINGMEIPFDFDAGGANKDEKTDVWTYESGYGCVFNDFELSDCYDEEYAELGIKREDITPEFLASVTEIGEFSVEYTGSDGYDYAVCTDGTTGNGALELISIDFIERDTTNSYSVSGAAIEAYNEQFWDSAVDLFNKRINGLYDKFRSDVLGLSNEEIFNKAYEIRFYNEIQYFVENVGMDEDFEVSDIFCLLSYGDTLLSSMFEKFVDSCDQSIETSGDTHDFIRWFARKEWSF